MRAIDVSKIEELLSPAFVAMGFAIVLVRLTGGKERPTLQILAERADGGSITLDECATLSREASALIDVEDIIDDAYVLEVSSPGIERPLVKPADFEKYTGREAAIELREKQDGKRRFKGKLLVCANGVVRISDEGIEYSLPLSGIMSAKLIIGEDLFKPKNKETFKEVRS